MTAAPCPHHSQRLLTWLALWICLASGCERAASSDAPTASPAQASVPLRQRLLDKTFDNIKFEIPAGTTFARHLLTPAIEQLFGQRIRIRGYIYPTLKKRGLTQFVLVRDNLECCFGPGAALFDCIMVRMQPGKTAEYTIRPVAVEGTFQLNVQEFDGTVVAIYELEGERVE